VLLIVGSVLIGTTISVHQILADHYGSQFANSWIWIFALLNTSGFISACARGFDKLKGK